MDYLTDPLFLSRVQFALTTAFHILFPPLTIGLAVYLVVVEWLWLKTHDLTYYRQFRFWVGPFCRQLRRGRGFGHPAGIPVRHQLGAAFGHGGQLFRPDPGL